jgi:hypothetical protein
MKDRLNQHQEHHMHTTHASSRRALLPSRRRIALSCLVLSCLATWVAGVAAAPPAPAATAPIVLYDGALGTMPNSQGWTYFADGGSASPAPDGATTLDTSIPKDTYAGYFAAQGGFLGSSAPVPALDRAVGYTISFTVQVELEDHAGSDRNDDNLDDRAGFSLIVLSSDKQGIELGFWKDRIWAQEGGSGDALFTQAEGAPFNTQAGRIGYALTVQGDGYTLSSSGAPILSGKLRDYTAFNGLPDPYKTPNLIFLGDDTSSAGAKIQLAYIAVGPVEAGGTSLNRKVYVPLLNR